MAEKQVKVKVTTDVETSEVEALENEIAKLKDETITVNVEEDGVDTVKDGINDIGNELDAVDDDPITPQVDNIAAMESIEQISQGFDRLKNGARELKGVLDEALAGAGKRETNETFLEMSIGAEKAKTAMEGISKVVQELPGDDTAIQGLLSSAVAKNASMTRQELQSMGSVAADYFSAMSFYGKNATEAQQDMTNYILAGNTAELERSPILQAHIDKLKEANTPMERTKALQEAMNEEGWLGMSQQDTYNNKLETFNGMLQRGQDNFGKLFMEGSKGAMDFALQLDEATNGIFGMGIAAMGLASPITDSVMGLGQMAMGVKAIKDLGFIKYLKDLEIMTKLSAAADWLLSGAQAVLNAVMSMNPIFLIVIALVALAAALIWAYYNVDWFREMVDNAFASITSLAQQIYGMITPAIQWLGNLFNQFTSQLGLNTKDWVQAVLGFILFLPLLPQKLGVALINAIAKVLRFGNNFVQNLTSTGSRAVSNFFSYISQIPSRLSAELNGAFSRVQQWASTLPQKFWEAGVNAVKRFLEGLGIASPGTMQRTLVWEINEMARRTPIEGRKLLTNIGGLSSDVVDEFGEPNLKMGNVELGNSELVSNLNLLNNNGAGVFRDLILNVGTVDDEKRVYEIVDAVQRALSWDNKTAGRRV